MIKLLFNEEKRVTGYASEIYNESKNELVIEVSESELNKLIPDSFEETEWKEVRRHYKLVDGELVFDEG